MGYRHGRGLSSVGNEASRTIEAVGRADHAAPRATKHANDLGDVRVRHRHGDRTADGERDRVRSDFRLDRAGLARRG